MRVLIEATINFKPSGGGISEFTHQIALALSRDKNTEVRVLSRKFDNYPKNELNVEYDIQRFPFVDDKLKVRRFRNSFVEIRSTIEDWDPDLIISNFLSLESQIGYWLAQERNIPFYLLLHGQELNRNFGSSLRTGSLNKWLRTLIYHQFVMNGADGLICNSEFTANLAQSWGASPNKIEIIPPVIDTDEQKNKTEHPESLRLTPEDLRNKTVFFSLCNLRTRKGIDNVIKALNQIHRSLKDYYYLIGGTGNQECYLKTLVDKFGLNDSVKFLGYVPEEEKGSYFNLADIFVMPSRELENGSVEGFGIVYLEAGFYGLPVIGGNSGGIPDAIVHERTGLLVDPEDPKKIGDAMLELASDPDLARKYGTTGQKRVKSNFTINNLNKNLRKMITF